MKNSKLHIIFSILSFLSFGVLTAQTAGIVLNGSDLKIVGSGNVKFVLSDMNYTNNANATLNSGTTEVIFKGQTNSTIGGSSPNNFYDMENLKSSNISTLLGSNLTITRKLSLNSGYLDLNGKTLNYAGGIYLSASGQNLKAASANSKMNFTASSQIPSNLLFDDAFANLEISGGTVTNPVIVSNDANFDVLNDLTIGSNSTFTVSAGSNVVSKGDISNSGVINGAGSVSVNATSGDQTISGTAISVGNLTVNKDGGNLFVDAPLTVSGVLNLTKGNIINSQLITIGTGSANPGSINYTSTTNINTGEITGPRITGALRRYFIDDATPGSGYYFPVGNASHTRGATIDFTSSPGTDQYLTVQYQGGAAGGSSTPLYTGLPLTTQDGVLIQNFDEEGFWEINPTLNDYSQSINGEPYTITLQMKNLSTVNDRSTVRIIKAAGSNSPAQHHNAWTALTFGQNPVSGNSDADFTVTGTATGFSWFGAASGNNNPLPVELLSFNGTCNEGMVNLVWQTASEFNSSHFDVEKSTDGETWRVLATVPSAGTSNELLTYQTVDNNGTFGSNYYRLRQVDIDGKEKLYDPINVSCAETTAGYFTSYPNPSGNEFQVIVNNKEILGACTLNIVDAQGKVIDQRSIEVKDGINMFVISEKLTPGIYFLNITNGTKTTQVIKHAVK
jgi:hypothetical protein